MIALTRAPFVQLQRGLRWLEDAVLIGVLAIMIGLGATQILLRMLTGNGFTWGDALLRVLVLWAALIGAMVAARNDAHIRIDVLHQFLPRRAKPLVDRMLWLLCSAVSLAMAWFAARFVADERNFGMTAFAEIPAWLCELIIPIAFAVLGLRYLLLAGFGKAS